MGFYTAAKMLMRFVENMVAKKTKARIKANFNQNGQI